MIFISDIIEYHQHLICYGEDSIWLSNFRLNTEEYNFVINYDTKAGSISGTVDGNPKEFFNGPEGNRLMVGSFISLTASEKPGYIFIGWSLDGKSIISTDYSYSFTLLNDANLTPVFMPENIIARIGANGYQPGRSN